MQPIVRTAVLADAPVVADLVHRAYRGDSSRAGWTTEADLLDGQRIGLSDVEAKISAPDAEILLAEAEGILGCCEIEQRPGGVAYFGMFAVEPRLQGGGIGGLLLDRAESRARELWGATTMEMTVLAQRTDLIPFYERRGYTRTGDIRPFPYGDEAFGQPRRDDLVFEVLAKTLS
jgi:GNAT superfamily N-acetyltransferase